jgi:anti-sigma factor RsiW
MNFRDVELLSAYLDGQLSSSEAARLESRLERERDLRGAMQDLRASRTALRALPRRKAPRNFTLQPHMARLEAPAPTAFPVLRFASVLASVLFLATVAVNGLTPLAASRLAAAPGPAYGMGGGGQPAEAATVVPAASPEAMLAAPPTPGPEQIAPAPDLQAQAQKNVPQAQEAPSSSAPIVPTVWQWILAGLAIILGLSAWYLRSESTRRFRRRWVAK